MVLTLYTSEKQCVHVIKLCILESIFIAGLPGTYYFWTVAYFKLNCFRILNCPVTC